MEMLFGGLTHVGPRNHVLDGDQDLTNHSQPQGTTSRRCGLLPNYFGHCFTIILYVRLYVWLSDRLGKRCR